MTIPTLFEDTVSEPAQEAKQPNPDVIERLRLEKVLANAVSEKEQLRKQYAEVRSKGIEIQGEIDKLESAIRSAEHRSQILSAPRADYIDARAQQIAAGLMGEAVELSTIERSADFASNLTTADLSEGIRTLKRKRDDLLAGLNMIKAKLRICACNYYRAHAHQHGARFELLRSEISSEFIQLQAAHKLNLRFDGFSPILLESMSEMVLPGIDEADAMIPLRKYERISSRDLTGNTLAQSGLVDQASASINAELEGK